MAGFKHRVLQRQRVHRAHPSCLDAEVCPGPALSDFVVGSGPLRRAQVRAALRRTARLRPAQVAPVDPKTGLPGHTALLSFGIRAQSLEDQQALIERVRGEIGEPGTPGGPPAGVDVQLAGLPVVAAAAAERPLRQPLLGDPGRAAGGRPRPAGRLPLAFRAPWCRWRRCCSPAAGRRWSSGPAASRSTRCRRRSGALTIAIATEFSVILSARFHEERDAGRGARRGAGGGLRAHRRRRARLGPDRDRRLRRPDRQRHDDAARLRPGHRDRPRRRPGRGDGGAAGGARHLGGASDEGPLLDRGRADLLRRRRDRDPPPGRRRQLDPRPRPAAAPLAAAGVRGAAGDAATLEGDANVAQDDCGTSQLPCPGPPHAGLPGRGTGRVPGLRPLRPALGDLVLVHQRRRLRRTAGCRQPRLRALPWTGGIPLAGRPRRPRHRARTGARTRLADAGRLRPRRGGVRPLPRRGLSDLRLRVPRGDPAERQRRRPHRRPAVARLDDLLRATRAAEGGGRG